MQRFQQHGRPARNLLSGSHAVSTRGENGEEKVAAPPTPPGEELLGSAGSPLSSHTFLGLREKKTHEKRGGQRGQRIQIREGRRHAQLHP